MKPQTKRNVVIVDDDPAVRDSLIVILSLAGQNVTAFSCAEDLLSALPVLAPDVLVIDVQMPHMGGLELVRRINARGLQIPTILISGNAADSLQSSAEQVGVSHILKKPFSGLDLLTLMDRMFG